MCRSETKFLVNLIQKADEEETTRQTIVRRQLWSDNIDENIIDVLHRL